MNGDTLTLDHVLRAVEFLRDAQAPRFDGEHYYAVLSFTAYQDVHMMELEMRRPYRVRATAWNILAHERRRLALKRRVDEPTAREAFDRALRLEEF